MNLAGFKVEVIRSRKVSGKLDFTFKEPDWETLNIFVPVKGRVHLFFICDVPHRIHFDPECFFCLESKSNLFPLESAPNVCMYTLRRFEVGLSLDKGLNKSL